LNEATIKALKENKKVTSLKEEVIDGSDITNEPLSDYNPEYETNMIRRLNNVAREKA